LSSLKILFLKSNNQHKLPKIINKNKEVIITLGHWWVDSNNKQANMEENKQNHPLWYLTLIKRLGINGDEKYIYLYFPLLKIFYILDVRWKKNYRL
jgi:hypothetical protein